MLLSDQAAFVYAEPMTETAWPNLREADFILRDFRFASGETLPELRQHYFTIGDPKHPARAADPQHHRHREVLA